MRAGPAGRLRLAALLPLILIPIWMGLPAVGQGRGKADQTTHKVVIDGTAFAPATVRVKVGDRVTWTNTDPFAHTVTSREGRFDSKEIAAGASWTHLTTTQGQFSYICTLHPTMKGTLIVEP